MTQAKWSGAFSELMAIRAMTAPEAGEVTITGSDPFYRTPFRIGETAAAVLAATGVAANDLWELRTNRRQAVVITVPEAAATLRVVDYTMKRDADGQYRRLPVSDSMKHMVTVTQPWPTADGRWFLPHFNLPHLERRVLDVLKCESAPASVSAAVGRWNADALEAAIADVHACGGKVRTAEEWLAHPQGAYLAARPVVEITKVAEGKPEPLPSGGRPLSGVRVLDLTRILAGPTAGRTLAEHGADVLMVAAPHLPQVPEFVRDLSHGKRSCFLDLGRTEEVERLTALAQEADVFVNGYRPGRLGEHGFGLEELVRLRPGMVVVSINCFGSGGPFATKGGWEQVAQSVTGIAHTHGEMTGAGRPKLAPAPMCDYLTGYLAAYGAMLALSRRARFYQRQGLVDDFDHAPEQLTEAELEPLYVREDSSYGDLLTLGPVLSMSETPCQWALPTPKLGGDRPEWLARDGGRAG